MNIVDTFQNRLQKALDLSNMKPVDLHIKTGLSESIISRYLAGTAHARAKNVSMLADVLDVNEIWLMGYDVPMQKNIDEYTKSEILSVYIAKDDSMFPILDVGDKALYKRTNEYTSGDTILFSLDNNEYIRKIIEVDGLIEFIASNPFVKSSKKYTHKELKEKNFTVIGKVIKAENTSAFK